MRKTLIAFAGAAFSLAATAAVQAADITVGFVTSLSGPISSIGIPYDHGIKAGFAHISEIGGKKVKLVPLDDASDPSTSAKNARKLIEEEKVDVIIGTAGAPGSLAIVAVAREAKTPVIVIANANLTGDDGAWMVTVPQAPTLMVSAVVEEMKKAGVKTVGFIGFSDAWGDLVYNALTATAQPAGITVTTNERYARADNSVTAQALKVIATRPDAVLTGGSGTPGALPYLALAERGYRGKLYGTHALINPDFVRVGGASVEGLIAPTGPAVVSEQLPDGHPLKKVGEQYRAALAKAVPDAKPNAFSAYAFDGWLIFADAAKRALGKAEPGTVEFRTALRDAIVSTKELVGTHAVYNFKPTERYGTDERSRVLVTLEKGTWKLMK